MCLVCFINAEESRSKKQKDVYCQPSSSSSTDSCTEDNSDADDAESGSIQGSHAIHYFAIGSMTNTTALALRELTPISSVPATLPNHRMLFRSSGGMATAEKDEEYELLEEYDEPDYPFSCIHGVLHLLSAAQMKILDDFEGGYKRRACKVLLYDGCTEVHAFVYLMDRTQWVPSSNSKNNSPEGKHKQQQQEQSVAVASDKPKLKHELPTERYLDIIAQGCAAPGVDPQWVQYIRSHRCIPRKSASEFSSFSSSMTAATVPIVSWEQLRACNGVNGAPLWIVINNKVLEFKGDVTSFFPFGYFIKHKIGGTDFTVKFAKGFFEPKYITGYTGSSSGARRSIGGGGGGGVVGGTSSNFSAITASCEMGNEHRAWVEDQFANPPPVLASSKWALVGVVEVATATSDAVTLTRNSTFGIRKSKHISCNSSGSLRSVATRAMALAGAGMTSSTISTSTSTSSLTAAAAYSTDSTAAGRDAINPASNPLVVAATIKPTAPVLNLTEDILAGFNHFFISGTAAFEWIIPDGIHPGQTLYVRKTATENFANTVVLRIKNQNLASPNVRSDSFEMPVNTYYLSWCWDGEYWYLEQEGKSS